MTSYYEINNKFYATSEAFKSLRFYLRHEMGRLTTGFNGFDQSYAAVQFWGNETQRLLEKAQNITIDDGNHQTVVYSVKCFDSEIRQCQPDRNPINFALTKGFAVVELESTMIKQLVSQEQYSYLLEGRIGCEFNSLFEDGSYINEHWNDMICHYTYDVASIWCDECNSNCDINLFHRDIKEAARAMKLRFQNCQQFTTSFDFKQLKLENDKLRLGLNEIKTLKTENVRLKLNLQSVEKALGIVSYNYEALRKRIDPLRSELKIVQRTMIRIIRTNFNMPVAVLVSK